MHRGRPSSLEVWGCQSADVRPTLNPKGCRVWGLRTWRSGYGLQGLGVCGLRLWASFVCGCVCLSRVFLFFCGSVSETSVLKGVLVDIEFWDFDSRLKSRMFFLMGHVDVWGGRAPTPDPHPESQILSPKPKEAAAPVIIAILPIRAYS